MLLSLISGAALSLAAGQTPDTAPVIQEMNRRSDSLSRLDPAREVERAIARGDWRFVGVAGYAVVAPGVAFADPRYPKDLREIRVIEGTSDFVIGQAGERLNKVAAEYAEQYNRLLLKRLRGQATGRFPPSSRLAVDDRAVFAVLGAVFIAAGLPLSLRRVRPNGWYGVRTPATLADDQVWYEANAIGGRDIIALGALLLLLVLVLPSIVQLSHEGYRYVYIAVLLAGTLGSAVRCWRKANRLLRDRRSGGRG